MYASAFDNRKLTPGSLLLDVTTKFDRAPGLGAARRRPARARPGPRPQGAPVLTQHPGHPGAPAGRQRRRRQDGRGARASASRAGARRSSRPGWPARIGTVEVRPLDLTSAYGGLANGGDPAPAADDPRDRRAGRHGRLEGARSRTATQAVSPQAAFLVTDILAGNTDKKQNPIWSAKLALHNGKGGTLPAGRGQDRHLERGPRPRDVRLPGAARPTRTIPAWWSASGWATAITRTRAPRPRPPR